MQKALLHKIKFFELLILSHKMLMSVARKKGNFIFHIRKHAWKFCEIKTRLCCTLSIFIHTKNCLAKYHLSFPKTTANMKLLIVYVEDGMFLHLP